MKRMMFVGENSSGKEPLIAALYKLFSGKEYIPRKAMAVEYVGPFINTPGEFLENRRFYSALITTSADCDVFVMVQSAANRTSLFPPQFATMFNRRVVGVVSDCQRHCADVARAERFLHYAGARDIIPVDVCSPDTLSYLKQILEAP